MFATSRSFDGPEPRRLSPEEMTDEERTVMKDLRQELMRLRNNALRDGPSESEATRARVPGEIEQSLNASPWRFPDGHAITIVCAQWPPNMLSTIPYTDVDDPDYIELLTYSELDALLNCTVTCAPRIRPTR